MNHLAELLTLELIYPNFATKTDIKIISHVDTSGFALKSNLTSLKTEVGKLAT